MANWAVLRADELVFENVSGVEAKDGILRYVLQRNEDGSFGTITAGERTIQPAASLVYVHGDTVHVQLS